MKKKFFCFLSYFTRKFPFKGMERILRLIYNPDKRYGDYFETVIPYDKGLFININTSSFIEWSTFFKGYYEKKITLLFEKFIKEGMTVFDVGANVGVHTLTMSRLVGDSGKVIAVEPHPLIANRLRDNVNLNNVKNVVIKELALSDSLGEMILYGMEDSCPHHGVASFYKQHSEFLKEEISVSVLTLDAFVNQLNLERVDFLKIDTEGNDMRVLLGGRAVIEKFRPIILLEYDKVGWGYAGHTIESFRDFFENLDYILKTIDDKSLDHLLDFDNILAIPKSFL